MINVEDHAAHGRMAREITIFYSKDAFLFYPDLPLE